VGDKIMATSLKSAIAEYVNGMKAAGVVINTNAAAIILASKYPKSGLPMQDVVWEIEEEANRVGAHLTSGQGSNPSQAKE
jgi:hypothetical protein